MDSWTIDLRPHHQAACITCVKNFEKLLVLNFSLVARQIMKRPGWGLGVCCHSMPVNFAFHQICLAFSIYLEFEEKTLQKLSELKLYLPNETGKCQCPPLRILDKFAFHWHESFQNFDSGKVSQTQLIRNEKILITSGCSFHDGLGWYPRVWVYSSSLQIVTGGDNGLITTPDQRHRPNILGTLYTLQCWKFLSQMGFAHGFCRVFLHFRQILQTLSCFAIVESCYL